MSKVMNPFGNQYEAMMTQGLNNVALLRAEFEAVKRERDQYLANLTAVQTRCTELVEENRELRSENASLQHVNNRSVSIECYDAAKYEWVQRAKQFANYQKAALRTWNAKDSDDNRLLNACLGLAGEQGELIDLIKKRMFHGKVVTRDQLVSEAGDCLYYLAVLCRELGLDLGDVAEANIEKLRKRYPEGFVEGGGIR